MQHSHGGKEGGLQVYPPRWPNCLWYDIREHIAPFSPLPVVLVSVFRARSLAFPCFLCLPRKCQWCGVRPQRCKGTQVCGKFGLDAAWGSKASIRPGNGVANIKKDIWGLEDEWTLAHGGKPVTKAGPLVYRCPSCRHQKLSFFMYFGYLDSIGDWFSNMFPFLPLLLLLPSTGDVIVQQPP